MSDAAATSTPLLQLAAAATAGASLLAVAGMCMVRSVDARSDFNAGPARRSPSGQRFQRDPTMARVPSISEELTVGDYYGDGTEALRNGGFSMKEALAHSAASAQEAGARTPKTVLSDLQRGNTRFWMGVASRPEKSAFERRALIQQQFPAAAILGCSDSRVPIEIVFDQGLGDLFVIRVAGNCLDTATTGSLEYATNHLKVKVLVVMGHSGCGAVKAAQLPAKDLNGEPEDLRNLLKGLKTGLDAEKLGHISDPRACDREAVSSNVKSQVARLEANPAVKKRVASGELKVVGAFYDMASGIVDFYE